MHIPSNTTPNEFFKYYCQDPHANTVFAAYAAEVHSIEKESEYIERRNEVLEEQIYFARNTLDGIERELERCDTLEKLYSAISKCLDISQFER